MVPAAPAVRDVARRRHEGFGELPECLVSYDVVQAGGSVQFTMMESHSWEVPEAILKGGQSGWPKILSSLKSVLETGRSLSIAGHAGGLSRSRAEGRRR